MVAETAAASPGTHRQRIERKAKGRVKAKSSAFEQVPTDRVRAYWNRRPCNIRHSPKQIGTREYFEEVEARKYLVEPHIPIFADFGRWRGKRVLEIGCGIGTDTMNFARQGARVTAVDLSERSVEIARLRAEVFDLSAQIDFYVADAEQLAESVAPAPYDLVYSFGVIHHTPHPEVVIEGLRRYMKAGSELRLMVYHRLSWKVLWIVLVHGRGRFWRVNELVARHSEAETGCPVTYTYTRREIRRLIERYAYEVKETKVHHIFPYNVKDYTEYRYRFVWYFRWMPGWLFRALQRTIGWHLCVRAVAK